MADTETSRNSETSRNTDTSRAIAAAAAQEFERVTDAREVDQLDRVCHADLVNHALAATRTPGLAGTREYLASPLADRFGETWQQRRVITDGEYVVHHGLRTGHWPGGDFLGISAPAGDYTREVVFMYRVRDGKIAERWAIRDDLGFLRQLGASLT
jgi:predicted ester cyclase